VKIGTRPEAENHPPPVRRSWVRRAAKGAGFRTGFSVQSRYGYVCRVPTLRALRASR
jgi:hypothetical protein